MSEKRFDAIVIGAGFSGLYMLHRLRELGVRAMVLEKAENVGGTWLFNRYPGARCDIESIEYSYSFSEEIQQEWVWTETMPAQPEIEAYLNFVADRLDLRRDISFDTAVVSMDFDEAAAQWVLRTEAGESYVAPFVIAAAGILSVPLEPDIPGMDSFTGTSLFTSRWPRGDVDLHGKRVGVIGTGSTGVQLIPVIAPDVDELVVFQRSPAYTLPWSVRALEPGELDEMKGRYGEIRAAQRQHPVGAARLSAFSVLIEMLSCPPIKSASRRGAAARGRRARHRGSVELGRHLLRHRGQPDGHRALRGGDRADRQRSRDRGRPGAQPPVRLQAAHHRPGLLRDVQPGQRHSGRPAQDPDPRGDAHRHRHRGGVTTTST